MKRDERHQLHAIIDEVSGWSNTALAAADRRTNIDAAADKAISDLRRSVCMVQREGRMAWRVLPLRDQDAIRLTDIARKTNLPPISGPDERALQQVRDVIPHVINDAGALFGARRLFSGRKKKEAGETAAQFLAEYRTRAILTSLPALLARVAPHRAAEADVSLADALSAKVGLAPLMADLGRAPTLIPREVFAALPAAVRTIKRALRDEDKLRTNAIEAGNAARRADTRRLLAGMPVERLKEATRDRLRIGPLAEAGLNTVCAVLDYRYSLGAIPGIGEKSSIQILGAAQTLWQTTFDEMPARIDINKRTPETTEFLKRLAMWDALRDTKNATSDLARADELTNLARSLDAQVRHAIVFSTSDLTTSDFQASVDVVVRRANLIAGKSTMAGSPDPWQDFLSRPADYFGMLAELGFITEDENKTHGDLPDEIVEAVRALTLNTEHLTVGTLRGYQSFGARFALVQHKVIIGDEMGLGKTIEALAVLAHLRSQGHHHAAVICPAAVVTNWIREITAKSTLRAHRLHGTGRDGAARNWLRNGGVAVTTFETLRWFEPRLDELDELGCVVVDEAHYIKNPDAKRSQHAATIMGLSDRAVLLTGTPLENRIEEFANLVGYLQPKLVVDTSGLSPRLFRKQVAPAYLRRNQEDVLTELPELVEVDEWLPLSPEDSLAYRDAVAEGNFMAMRQAAMTRGDRSEKVRRLKEIVAEAEDNGRRVIVFSHFREVLNQVARVLPGQVFGPLTGSVPAPARQVMVDQFSTAGRGAVLVSQIVAGGVGLNIQAASVVVICEPQLKPTTEWQAIARARRMGQLETVQVHRLLSEEGVDQRITEILARKRELFDDFARVSATADSAPEAFDVTETELARKIVAAERERLFAQPVQAEAASGSR